QAAAEEVVPDTIDQHAGHEGVSHRVGDLPSQLQPAAARGGNALDPGQGFEETTGYEGTGRPGHTADEDMLIASASVEHRRRQPRLGPDLRQESVLLSEEGGSHLRQTAIDRAEIAEQFASLEQPACQPSVVGVSNEAIRGQAIQGFEDQTLVAL